ncbi:Ntsr1 [Columba livia]|nr:Ntsr1 [Columba livia]
MHLNATAPAVPGGPPHLHPAGYANASNRSDLLPKAPDEEDLDVNTDIYSKVMVTVIYLALFLVGTVGNSITAYTLVRKKSLQNLQSTVHYHLASLAFSDLLIFLLCMPIELYNFIWVHHPWAFGGAVCKGYYFLRDACTYATALNIASLSVERYMAICHPFKAKSIMSRSRTKKFISCIWIASFLLAIPMIFTMGEIYGKDQDPDSLICTTIVDASTLKTVIQGTVLYFETDAWMTHSDTFYVGNGPGLRSLDTPCGLGCASPKFGLAAVVTLGDQLQRDSTLDHTRVPASGTQFGPCDAKMLIQEKDRNTPGCLAAGEVNTFISFVFPMVVISVLNTIIANQLMVMFKQAAQENQVCTIGGQQTMLSMSMEPSRVQALKHGVRVLRAVVIAFVVCWLPYHIRRLMFCYVPSSHWTDFLFNFYHYFYMLTNVLFYVSSAINPILYNLVSANFRQIFLSTLTLLCLPWRKKKKRLAFTRKSNSISSNHTFSSQVTRETTY